VDTDAKKDEVLLLRPARSSPARAAGSREAGA
jgi:hypothetical protein